MRHCCLRRMAVLFAGLLFMASGIAFCIRAGLGITPISCPPYVLSLGLPFSVGQFTIAMHLLLILGQKILLGKGFGRMQWFQIVLAMVFGCFIDAFMWLTSTVAPSAYPARVLLLLAGNALLALGMFFEISAHLIFVPTDGFVRAVSVRTGIPFPRLKIAFDVLLLVVSVVCSLALLGRIEGIREGTFVSAFMAGFFLGLIRRVFTAAGISSAARR